MRIAIAARTLSGLSGAVTLIGEQTRRLAAQGHEVHVFAEDIDAERFRGYGVHPHTVIRFPLGSTWRRTLFAKQVAFKTRGRFDLVNGHGDLLEQNLLTLHNCVHLAHELIHGGPAPDRGVFRIHRRQLEARAFRAVIANSRLMSGDLKIRFGIPDGTIRVVYPGYDPARFNFSDKSRLRAAVRAEWKLGPSDVAIGLLTSGDFKKRGVDIFLETLAALPPAAKENACGIVIGKGGNELAAARQKARDLGLESRVRFIEQRADVASLLFGMDVFFYPAVIEEFGMSVLEALVCGLPVLTSRCVGASEIMEPVKGLPLADKPDRYFFAAALSEWIKNTSLRETIGQSLRQTALPFTWDQNARQTFAVYEEVRRQ